MVEGRCEIVSLIILREWKKCNDCSRVQSLEAQTIFMLRYALIEDKRRLSMDRTDIHSRNEAHWKIIMTSSKTSGQSSQGPRGSLGCYYRMLGYPIVDCRQHRAKSRRNYPDRLEHLIVAKQTKVTEEVLKDSEALGCTLLVYPSPDALFCKIAWYAIVHFRAFLQQWVDKPWEIRKHQPGTWGESNRIGP